MHNGKSVNHSRAVVGNCLLNRYTYDIEYCSYLSSNPIIEGGNLLLFGQVPIGVYVDFDLDRLN